MTNDGVIFDTYSDQFGMSINALGAALVFGTTGVHELSDAASADVALPPQTNAIVRLSLEHTKLIALIMQRQLRLFETDSGVSIQVSTEVLGKLNITPGQWASFLAPEGDER